MSPQSDSEPLDDPSMNKTGGHQPQSGPRQKRISREQMNILRAERKCFNCRERGHKQWNCLELNSMKPPKPAIKAGAMSFIKMEELAERKARADVYVGSIGIIGSDPIKEPNRIPMSVLEGGSPAIEKYNQWDWPAMNWLHARLTKQLESIDDGNALDGIKKDNRIDIQPTMFRYSVQLDESDLIYNLTHKKVLGDHFDPKWVIDQILVAQCILADNRGDKFTDKRFSNYVALMLGMTRIPGQQSKIKKRRNKKCVIDSEGMFAVECMSQLRIKDKT